MGENNLCAGFDNMLCLICERHDKTVGYRLVTELGYERNAPSCKMLKNNRLKTKCNIR